MAAGHLACRNCQRRLLGALLDISSLALRPRTAPRRAPHNTLHSSLQIRFISTSRPTPRLYSTEANNPVPEEQTSSVPDAEPGNQDEPPQKDTPWYMKVSLPTKEASPLLKRQELPPLPADPPALLQPMLEHISVDLGLDDLTLFDLRHVDPPPALGGNLIMIVGTARSEKHLHVSADRLCQWLKYSHGLKPSADGLMGKGELKIKLRRKARRAKMLSRVGAKQPANFDDGLRTGWVCVQTGGIPDGRVVQQQDTNFIGFRDEQEGATVVVQMLTEEKRKELDLENLWAAFLKRFERKAARIGRNGEVDEDGPVTTKGPFHPTSALLRPSYSTNLFASQKRFHTTIRKIKSGPEAELPTLYTNRNNPLFASSVLDEEAPRPDQTARLQEVLDQVTSLPAPEAKAALESPESSFWKTFNEASPRFPSVSEFAVRLDALCHAQKLEVPCKDQIAALLHQIEDIFINIPESVYLNALRALLLSPVQERHFAEAISALERFYARGHTISSPHERSYLRWNLASALIEVFSSGESHDLKPDALHHLRVTMDDTFGPAGVGTDAALMQLCARAGRWSDVWDIWNSYAWAIRTRPQKLYMTMLHCLINWSPQEEIEDGLRECVLEMELEQPPLALDPTLAQAIRECLERMRPDISVVAVQETAASEWVDLWTKCTRVVNREEPQSQSQSSKVDTTSHAVPEMLGDH